MCSANRDGLRRMGVLYPDYGGETQHSKLMWDVQRSGDTPLLAYLAECREAAAGACHTVLLSGEDFENALVDLSLAQRIERAALGAGFDALVWAVVHRQPAEYAESIYAEMSKHDVVLRRSTVLEALAQSGCLYVSTKEFNYIFALDYERFAGDFAAALSGKVWAIPMDEFVAGRPGACLLAELVPAPELDSFLAAAEIPAEPANKRAARRSVEEAYVATALELTARQRRKWPWTAVVRWLAGRRL